jgi:alkaline phosphatase D
VGLNPRGTTRRGLALALGAAAAGCVGTPVLPQPDGKRTTPRTPSGGAPAVLVPGGGTAVVAPGGSDPASVAEWRGPGDPFTLGVAAGAPRADGATIWTRLAPRPLEDGGGADPVPVRVRWEVQDEGGSRVVASGAAVAEPAWGHSVRVELAGLQPGRAYRYRFASGDAASASGRFRTAPAAGSGERLRLVFASCQQFEQGWYAAWRHAAAESPDLIAFLGDYIYESSWGRRHVRKHDPGTPRTLEAYRRRHALYRGDADLQAAHAACAWVLTWDDHEVENDYADDRSERGEPREAFLARRAAAYRAYFEHMPLPWSVAPRGPSMRLYGHVDWGAVARIHVLDDRQYRTPQACSAPGFAGSRTVGPDCAERLDPARTMLGAEQEAWLARSLGESRARANVIAQQTLIGRCDRRPGPEEAWWTDGWDGYPAARRRLLEAVRTSGAARPLAIGGDVHAFYAGELHEDFDRPAARPVMTEFVGGSISSQGPTQRQVQTLVDENPNLRWAGGGVNGYGVLDLGPAGATVTLRAIDDVGDARAGVRTLRRLEVPAGTGRIEG